MAKTPENGGAPAVEKAIESKYDVADIVGVAQKRFGVSAEIAATAMKMAGKTQATISEAETIIKRFTERKV